MGCAPYVEKVPFQTQCANRLESNDVSSFRIRDYQIWTPPTFMSFIKSETFSRTEMGHQPAFVAGKQAACGKAFIPIGFGDRLFRE
jgi:hypothetical protein